MRYLSSLAVGSPSLRYVGHAWHGHSVWLSRHNHPQAENRLGNRRGTCAHVQFAKVSCVFPRTHLAYLFFYSGSRRLCHTGADGSLQSSASQHGRAGCVSTRVNTLLQPFSILLPAFAYLSLFLCRHYCGVHGRCCACFQGGGGVATDSHFRILRETSGAAQRTRCVRSLSFLRVYCYVPSF